tara:strand:+ start:127 stop:963 length:837 start_codon:yes stop_codon:yes gene_type:complete
MTGFGISRLKNKNLEIIVEIKSVNHRFLETTFKFNENNIEFEDFAKKEIGKKVRRGKIDINIKINSKTKVDFEIDRELLSDLQKFLKKESLISKTIKLRDIKDFPGMLKITKSKLISNQKLKQVFKQALANYLVSRNEEGSKIEKVLVKKIKSIESKNSKISSSTKGLLSKKIRMYKKRIKDLLENFDNQKVDQEIVNLAMKADVAEEIERINFHIQSLKKEITINSSSGKKIDFILQELFRESNTLTVKLDDNKAKNLALDIKILIEEMREQIQNVE